MNAIATKIQTGTAACAIAAAAILVPSAVAQADPAVPVPIGSLGGAAGAGSVLNCGPVGSPNCNGSNAANRLPSTNGSRAAIASPSIASPSIASPSIAAASPATIIQNPLQNFWVWIGTPNPNPPQPFTTFFTFQPLDLLPASIRPLFSWFEDINYEACVAGFTIRIGPYGTVTSGYSNGCA
jgi:hypothetical protein